MYAGIIVRLALIAIGLSSAFTAAANKCDLDTSPSLSITVVNELGNPVGGAHVVIWFGANIESAKSIWESTTDRSGKVVAEVAMGSLFVEASRGVDETSGIMEIVARTASVSQEVVITIRLQATVLLRIQTTTGDPMIGGVVSLEWDSLDSSVREDGSVPRLPSLATLDEHGEARLRVDAPFFGYIRATFDDGLSISKYLYVTSGELRRIDAVVAPDGIAVIGKLVGLGVQSKDHVFQIELTQRGVALPTEVKALAGEDFQLIVNSLGDYGIHIRDERYIEASPVCFSLSESSLTAPPIEIELAIRSQISGIVQKRGAPWELAWIECVEVIEPAETPHGVHKWWRGVEGIGVHHAMTNALGEFQFSELRPSARYAIYEVRHADDAKVVIPPMESVVLSY